MTAPHTSILNKDSEISFLQVMHLSSDYVCLKKNLATGTWHLNIR